MITVSENLQEHWEALSNADDSTRLKIARELVRLVIISPQEYGQHWVVVKDGLEEIDHSLQFILGCMNFGRLSTEQ
jgi:hypothetical protein